jgi:hypothetical protein
MKKAMSTSTKPSSTLSKRSPKAQSGGLCADEGGPSFVTVSVVPIGILHTNENGEAQRQKALV